MRDPSSRCGGIRDDSVTKLCARMRVRVGFLQTLDRHVGVDLRRREAGVTKQRLHAAQVRAAIEQVRGKTVTKFVRTDRNCSPKT